MGNDEGPTFSTGNDTEIADVSHYSCYVVLIGGLRETSHDTRVKILTGVNLK